MEHGKFILSLDFELHWGSFDKTAIENRIEYYNNTINVIPKILKLFQKYEIEATWATVGMLFNRNIEELYKNFPRELPQYNNNNLSAYSYIKNQFDNKYKHFHFSPNLINQINETIGQEIGTHTYSHYYCLEKGQSISEFSADIENCITIAKKNDININSIVLPRNQYNKNYNKICYEKGIKILRSNPNVWFWNSLTKETLLKKIFRTGDCYFPLFKSYFSINNIINNNNQPILLPASRFLRPVSKFNFLNKIKLKRIKNEMTKAAKTNSFYHLWFHPHNFGNHPKDALVELEELLQHFKKLNNTFQMKSYNMNSIYKTFFTK